MTKEIEKRLSILEERVTLLFESNTMALENELRDDAQVMAIYSIVKELAAKAGVPPELLQRHYVIRRRWWHDRLLRRAEDVSPGFAAKLDKRSPEEISDLAVFPSIFDPLPPDQS